MSEKSATRPCGRDLAKFVQEHGMGVSNPGGLLPSWSSSANCAVSRCGDADFTEHVSAVKKVWGTEHVGEALRVLTVAFSLAYFGSGASTSGLMSTL